VRLPGGAGNEAYQRDLLLGQQRLFLSAKVGVEGSPPPTASFAAGSDSNPTVLELPHGAIVVMTVEGAGRFANTLLYTGPPQPQNHSLLHHGVTASAAHAVQGSSLTRLVEVWVTAGSPEEAIAVVVAAHEAVQKAAAAAAAGGQVLGRGEWRGSSGAGGGGEGSAAAAASALRPPAMLPVQDAAPFRVDGGISLAIPAGCVRTLLGWQRSVGASVVRDLAALAQADGEEELKVWGVGHPDILRPLQLLWLATSQHPAAAAWRAARQAAGAAQLQQLWPADKVTAAIRAVVAAYRSVPQPTEAQVAAAGGRIKAVKYRHHTQALLLLLLRVRVGGEGDAAVLEEVRVGLGEAGLAE
jgi:hypothetical protein